MTFRVPSQSIGKLAIFTGFSLPATLLIILGTMIAAIPALAEFRQPPNSRIAIDLDERYIPAPRFSGFFDPESSVSYVMIEMSGGAYDELKSMPDHTENLAQRGMTDARISKLPGRTGEYVYFTATQTQAGIRIAKFILIFSEKGLTGLVTVNVPETILESGTLTRKQVEKTLATVKMSDKPGPQAKLFKLGYLGPFKLAAKIAGTGELYNLSGTVPKSGVNRLAKEAAIIVAPSLDQSAIGAIERAAKARFMSLTGLYDLKITSGKRVTISGFEGYRISGEAASGKDRSERDIAVIFVMLSGKEGGYFILFGTVPIAQKAELMPEQDKVISSFKAAR